MATSGYSGTPLAKKLGIKPGFVLRLIYPPEHYFSLFTDMPADVTITDDVRQKKPFIHLFTKDTAELTALLPQLKNEITDAGMIWISWPKKASKIPTTVTEDLIRNTALSIGLVDIKVCAVDDTWSGLKLVIPVKKRQRTVNR